MEALVPAAVLAEACRQAGRADEVQVHAGADLFGLAWEGGSIVTATLGDVFPDAQLDRLVDVTPECVIEVESDALAAAVDRAARCGGAYGQVAVQAIDGAVLIRASDPLSIMYTSGSTGRPKGCILPHGYFTENACEIGRAGWLVPGAPYGSFSW